MTGQGVREVLAPLGTAELRRLHGFLSGEPVAVPGPGSWEAERAEREAQRDDRRTGLSRDEREAALAALMAAYIVEAEERADGD